MSDWPAVTPARVHEVMARRLGMDIEELRRTRRDNGRQAIVWWRKDGPQQVRFGVFEPGADAVLDTLYEAYQGYLHTTIRFSLIELAKILRKG